MGANLTRGKICNDRLVCPFHAWEFGADGKCTKTLNADAIPDYARLQTYPVTERHGLVFMFYGKKALYELPFFPGCDPDNFFHDKVFDIHQDGEWYIVPSNAFDITHFVSVHKRTPIEPPVVRAISPYARQITLRYRIEDDIISDRFARTFLGKVAELDFTVWSGNQVYAVTTIGKLKNYMMIFIEPLPKGHSVSKLFVYSPGQKKGPVYRAMHWVPMRLRSIFSQRFFQREADMLKNIKFSSLTFLPSDQMLKEYLVWLNELGSGEHS